jgi:hypothetical protein
MRKLVWMGLVVAVGGGGASSAQASASACSLVAHGQTLLLQADCRTDHTLVIPDGFALDGRGHEITAVDPPGGSFEGAVVQSGGNEAQVRNLRIKATNLAAVCHVAEPVDRRLVQEPAALEATLE